MYALLSILQLCLVCMPCLTLPCVHALSLSLSLSQRDVRLCAELKRTESEANRVESLRIALSYPITPILPPKIMMNMDFSRNESNGVMSSVESKLMSRLTLSHHKKDLRLGFK